MIERKAITLRVLGPLMSGLFSVEHDCTRGQQHSGKEISREFAAARTNGPKCLNWLKMSSMSFKV
jgi:hypothetical protein